MVIGKPFNPNPRQPLSTPSLQDVYDIYKKWLNVVDDRRIDIVLATALTREVEGTKIWLLLVGNSGDWKSEQLHALDDSLSEWRIITNEKTGETKKYLDKVYYDTRILNNLTPRTLVSGSLKAPDLAPQLQDKLVMIPEMAQILKLAPADKAELWAQLRDLYDGIAGKTTGSGKSRYYEDLNITLIGGSTPAIDTQILIHQDLGSRELIWRTIEGRKDKDDKDIMEKVWENEKAENSMRSELKDITLDFLMTKKYKKIEINDKVKQEIFKLSSYLCLLRAPAELDSYTGDLLNPPHPEMPTRILKQLKRLYISLKSLDNNYTDERALDVLRYLVRSSASQNRLRVFEHIINDYPKNPDKEYTSYEIAHKVGVGRKAVYRELNVLWGVNLIKRKSHVWEDNFGNTKEKIRWFLNDKHNLNIKLLESKDYKPSNNKIELENV